VLRGFKWVISRYCGGTNSSTPVFPYWKKKFLSSTYLEKYFKKAGMSVFIKI